jgi:iron complex transport system substrate-binding protein
MRHEIAVAAAAFILGMVPYALLDAGAPPCEPEVPQRVVCLSPSITELVFALGEGEKVVGVSAGVRWPPEALEVERVGGYLDCDLERLVGLRPDLVLIQGIHAYVNAQAQELGIRVCRLKMRTTDEIGDAAREVGSALGAREAAEELVQKIDRDLERVRARTRVRKRVRTFLHIAHGPSLPGPPFLTTNAQTFLGELLEVAGGANVFAGSRRPYSEVPLEVLIELAPKVVMVSIPGARLPAEEREAIKAAWRELFPASPGDHEVRVVFLTADCALFPGPRVGKVALEMERLL